MTRKSLYLATAPDAVFVHVHELDGPASGPAVLIVPPFGWDDIASHRPRREWADALAAAGHPAMRIDLPGGADSGGGPGDPDRVAAWTSAVAEAAAWLRASYGERRVVALGLGLGGLVAWTAAATGAAIDDLVLWGVPARGSTLVRELRAFASLKHDEWGDGDPPPGVAMLDDGFDVAGYVVSNETIDALSALDLTDLPLADPSARRVLLIGRDTLPADPRLREYAEACGMAVVDAAGAGWGAMVSGPQEAVLPSAVVALVAEWLASAPAAPLSPRRKPPAELDQLVLPGAVERPWTAQRGFGRQFGILALPDGGNQRPALGVVLLNAGAVRHSGPNRMWVEVARRWAARGVPVLRLDIEGLGDSDGDGRPYVDSARLYEPDLAAQAGQAVADLVAAGVADRWLVAGLCAGASWAFHAARTDDERITAAVLMNPFAFDWEDELAQERDVGRTRQLRRADGWKRLLSGDVSGERVRGVAAHALRTPLERGQRRRRMDNRVRREQADLDRLREGAKQITLLIGRDEPIFDRFGREGILDQLDRWPNVVLRRLPTRDHTFRAPWLQAHVHAELDAAIDAELQRAEPEATRARDDMPNLA